MQPYSSERDHRVRPAAYVAARCVRDGDSDGGDDDGAGLGPVCKSLSVVLDLGQLLHRQSFQEALEEINKYNHSAQAGRRKNENI